MRDLRPVLTLAVLLLLSLPVAAQDLVLLHLADTHSAYDRYPRLLSLVEETLAEYPHAETAVLFDGDVFELGNAVGRRSDGEADWAFLERLAQRAPVILNVGNHEFDFQDPDALMAEAEALGIEVIGNLVDRRDGAPLAPMVTTLEVDGRSVDVVGIATDQANTYAEPVRERLILPDPVRFARYLGPLTVLSDHVVLASHAGVAADREILRRAPEATLYMVGAHDHLVLEDASTGVPYVHGGFKGERLLVAEVTFEAGGGASVSFEERLTDEHEGVDAELARRVEALYEAHLEPEDREVIGSVERGYTVRQAADWAVRTLADATDADVALLNHTSFGAGFRAGEVRRFEFDAFMRFDNDVMVTEMDGETLAEVLARTDQGPETPLSMRSGDFLYASEVEPRAGETYRVVTSGWVALPMNQATYLGIEGVDFEPLEGVTTKGILAEALR